jgi:hypothetical protein
LPVVKSRDRIKKRKPKTQFHPTVLSFFPFIRSSKGNQFGLPEEVDHGLYAELCGLTCLRDYWVKYKVKTWHPESPLFTHNPSIVGSPAMSKPMFIKGFRRLLNLARLLGLLLGTLLSILLLYYHTLLFFLRYDRAVVVVARRTHVLHSKAFSLLLTSQSINHLPHPRHLLFTTFSSSSPSFPHMPTHLHKQHAQPPVLHPHCHCCSGP